MGILANISGKQAAEAFGRHGWLFDHQKGSHMIYKKPGCANRLSIPNHKELGPGILRSLIRDSGMSVEEFIALL